MEAKYYRFIYRNMGGGMCCSGSMAKDDAGGEDAFHFLYLGGGNGTGAAPDEEEVTEGHFHLMMLADFRAQTVKQAVQAWEQYRTEWVMFPKIPQEVRKQLAQEYEQTGNFTKEEIGFVKDPKNYLAGKGIADVTEVEEREVLRRGNRVFRIFAVGDGRERTLLFYHGSEGNGPQTQECVMSVKPATASRICSPFVNPKNLNCEMRCMLYNDFTQCKRHNQKNGTYFADGHLILGSEGTAVDLGEIRKVLKDEWKKIRFVCLPQSESPKEWKEQLLTVGTEEMAQYFMGTEEWNADAIKEILTSDPYRVFVFLRGKTGLCVSGYYLAR